MERLSHLPQGAGLGGDGAGLTPASESDWGASNVRPRGLFRWSLRLSLGGNLGTPAGHSTLTLHSSNFQLLHCRAPSMRPQTPPHSFLLRLEAADEEFPPPGSRQPARNKARSHVWPQSLPGPILFKEVLAAFCGISAILTRLMETVKPARRKQNLCWGQGFKGLPPPRFFY